MAEITTTVYTSHVPAIGAALDQGKQDAPYWRPIFDGYAPSRAWLREHTPDVILLVYNDHATAFSLDIVPTFAIGCADAFSPADEGWGARPVPEVRGHAELASHIAHAVIEDDFDLTIVRRMSVDHGLTVPLSLLFGKVEAWPCAVIPIAVNVMQYPLPSGRRCYALGQALARAVARWDEPLKIQVWGTGGMSHQLHGPRAGLINSAFDHAFMRRLVEEPEELARVPAVDYAREAGSEGMELVMWLVARGAQRCLRPRVVRRFYHVPGSNTAIGHMILSSEP